MNVFRILKTKVEFLFLLIYKYIYNYCKQFYNIFVKTFNSNNNKYNKQLLILNK
jgi:hypothetical protein